MKKLFLTLALTAAAMSAAAQSPDSTELILDPAEDPNNVVTVADIVKLQESVNFQQSSSSHYEQVWGYKSFLNLSYFTNATLNPKEEITLGFEDINGNKVPDFKADYGFALQLGHSYSMHKRPIANMVNINLDYTYIDLSMAHYKKEPGQHVYNSDNSWDEKNANNVSTHSYSYIPWCLGKYDINYGMNLGPSITVMPLTFTKIPDLHFIRINLYYHIGYQVGVLWMPNDKDADAATNTQFNDDSDPLKLNWQHGLTQSIGFNLSWKAIGIGFEKRFDSRTYKSFNTSEYGSESYKFKADNSRIYLRICY